MATENNPPIRIGRHLRPQKEWKEIIAIYLYMAGMGAGSFVIGTLVSWMGVELEPPFFSSADLFGYTLNLSKVPIFGDRSWSPSVRRFLFWTWGSNGDLCMPA